MGLRMETWPFGPSKQPRRHAREDARTISQNCSTVRPMSSMIAANVLGLRLYRRDACAVLWQPIQEAELGQFQAQLPELMVVSTTRMTQRSDSYLSCLSRLS